METMAYPAYADLLIDRKDFVLEVRINRPHRQNASPYGKAGDRSRDGRGRGVGGQGFKREKVNP
jgi:hypothetical protein